MRIRMVEYLRKMEIYEEMGHMQCSLWAVQISNQGKLGHIIGKHWAHQGSRKLCRDKSLRLDYDEADKKCILRELTQCIPSMSRRKFSNRFGNQQSNERNKGRKKEVSQSSEFDGQWNHKMNSLEIREKNILSMNGHMKYKFQKYLDSNEKCSCTKM